MKDTEIALTTYNNPYDPFTNSDSWYTFDIRNGTDCCGYLARVVDSIKYNNKKLNKTDDVFVDDEVNDEMIEDAMERIVKLNPLIYLIVHPNDKRYSMTTKEFNKTIPKVELVTDDDAN